ncbi:MAG: S41 family peptidase [Clostridia bacterium]|jgi:hypothetical protein
MSKQQLKTNILMGTTIGLLVLVFALSAIIWLNYDYLFFKYFISNDYIFTETLDKVFEDNIGIDIQKNSDYPKYFDNLAIELISNEISKTGNDPYTYQYTPSQYESYLENRSDKANRTRIEILNEETALFRFTNFSDESLDIFRSYIDQLKNFKNIIIDLRDNTGGDLDVSFKLASYFLKNNDIVYKIQYRKTKEIARLKTDGELDFENIIIMQNNYSASASEIFINALKENLDNITTVGTKTYGKGIGQTTYGIKNRYYIKATTFLVLTPNENSIHKTGITPDYEYTDDPTIIEYCLSILSGFIPLSNQ